MPGSFVKCVSSGTVILKGESAENKAHNSRGLHSCWSSFKRQQSLFSYAINCSNRLPVEFLMCYKFHVCFPQVDSTQAHCVRPCPVISAGLGRTSAEENPFTISCLQLYVLIGCCAQVCVCVTAASIIYICAVHQWPCVV